VLFVSHNMGAVTSLCQRAILLENGRISIDDLAPRAVADYLATIHESTMLNDGYVSLLNHPGRRKKHFDGIMRLTHCILMNGDGQPVDHLTVGEPTRIAIGYKMRSPVKRTNILFAVVISNSSGQRVSYLSSEAVGVNFSNIRTDGEVQCIIPRLPLVPGRYSLSLMCKVGNGWSDAVYDAVYLDVVGSNFYSTGRLPPVDVAGNLLIDHDWVMS